MGYTKGMILRDRPSCRSRKARSVLEMAPYVVVTGASYGKCCCLKNSLLTAHNDVTLLPRNVHQHSIDAMSGVWDNHTFIRIRAYELSCSCSDVFQKSHIRPSHEQIGLGFHLESKNLGRLQYRSWQRTVRACYTTVIPRAW